MHGSMLMDGRFGVDDSVRRRPSGTPDSEPRFGDVLAGRYELHSELGRGGMGRVFQAHDRLLGRDVALKVLTTPEDDDTSRQACLREARVAARVSHPNVAAVLDIGADHDLGVTFLVMELVPGRTLREVLGAAGTLAPSDAVQLVTQVAGALEATHARGVVHGDVTPRNVIVRPDGVAKLVDFGIARVLDASRPLEVRGRYGSIPYLAPEQVHGAAPDARSDVYALGAVLYELLVGEPPYSGRDTATVMAARLVADPPPPSGRNPAVSPALERVVLTALARDPKRRYASAGELREALCGVLSAATSDTRVLSRPAAADRPTRDDGQASGGSVAVHRPRFGRVALGLASLAIVLGLALLTAAFWRGVDTTEANSENTPVAAETAETAWASLTQPTCEWSNVATPPGICFGERQAGFRVRVVERQGPRWLIWDPTTNGVAYVDAAALKLE